MEQFPGDNQAQEQQRELARPMLSLDLHGSQGNVFAVIGHAREVVLPEEQEHFQQEIQAATASGAGKTYDDILEIVNTHVELIDASETHPVYGELTRIRDVTARYQRHVIEAVDKLNKQMQTLPETTPMQIDGIYPEFDDPEYSPEAYMAVLNFEIGRVEGEIAHSDSSEREALEQYRVMLRECRNSLRRAGVL